MAMYVGKRIVPIHRGAWDQSQPYEMLSIVLEEASGDSYISKRAVPAGTAITDETFWALHSKFSQQIKDMSDQLTETEQRIRTDNDETERTIQEDNQQTAAHIDESLNAAWEEFREKWASADTDMKASKVAFDETAQVLNERMDSIVAASAEGSDVEVADARVDSAGYAHETLGAAARDMDRRINISLGETVLLESALQNKGRVDLDTGEWIHGTLNPNSGNLDNSTQVIRTKGYLRIPSNAEFLLGGDFRIRIIEYRKEGAAYVFVSGKDWMTAQGAFRFNPDSWYILGLYSPSLKSDVTLEDSGNLTLWCQYLPEIEELEKRQDELQDEQDTFENLMVQRQFGIIDKTNPAFEVQDFAYASDGGGITDYHPSGSSYTTYMMVAEEDFTCYFDEILCSYTSISLYRDGNFKGSSFIARYREFNADHTLPTKENPIHVEEGMGVAITISQEKDFHLYTDAVSVAGYTFGNVGLSEQHKNVIRSLIEERMSAGKKLCMVKYSDIGTGQERSTEQINIYVPTVVGYLRYDFIHCVNESTNADNWRIGKLYSVDDNLNVRFPITQNGEWEMAITLKGRPDFMGGIAHGDEVVNTLAVFVDGKKTALESLAELTAFSELRIVEQTELFDPNDSVIHVADHGKEYLFTADDLHLRQTIKWLLDEELSASYMLMFPVYRGNDTASALQVTDRFYGNDDYTEYDVSVGGESSNGGYGWRKNVTKATIYSEKSGFSGTVEMLEQPSLPGGDLFMVQKTINSYNKLYWSIAGVNDTAEVKRGDRWFVHTRYQPMVNTGTDVD